MSRHTEVGEHDAANAYQSLSETTEHDDPRWAFGSGIVETERSWPERADSTEGAEITSPVPDGVDTADLAAYCLMLGDDALILSHRLAEWVSNAPELEEEVALANIALDLLGQARVLLGRAGHVEGLIPTTGIAGPTGDAGRGRDEDALAFQRTEAEFRNVALAELCDELDFAHCVGRLLLLSTWRLALMDRLTTSADPVLAAVAAKAVKELTYHRDYAARWTLRLGDGTTESHRRMQAALDTLWPFVGELFRTSGEERRLATAGVAVDPAELWAEVDAVLDQVFTAATLARPGAPFIVAIGGRAGRQGVHTEQLGHVLAALQSLARQHPGATW